MDYQIVLQTISTIGIGGILGAIIINELDKREELNSFNVYNVNLEYRQ
ncbi:hypothetical protein [Anaeromicrobium sediminis]|nr:hypothetical protein [Anaeromicrobium sediminis]